MDCCLTLALILCTAFHVAECCAYGPDCRFPCHCAIDAGCNSTTGQCFEGDCEEVPPPDDARDFGWKDAGCRRGNIAYKKYTEQSDTYNDHTSDRAVDGNTNPDLYEGNSCAHPFTGEDGPPAWWMVDLGKKHVIEEIIIFNRNSHRKRTSQFTIRIGMTSTIAEQDNCTNYHNPNIEFQYDITLTCKTGDMQGQYISMERWENSHEQASINICEFVVIGYEPMDCADNCNGKCDLLTGCNTCHAGYELPDCRDECYSKTWGVNCQNQCGGCADDEACNKTHGECPYGCAPWYLNSKCDLVIDEPSMAELSVEVVSVSSSDLNVTWQQLTNLQEGLDEHYFYRVQIGPVGGDKIISDGFRHDVKSSILTVAFNELIYNTEYEVRIIPYREQSSNEEAGIASAFVSDKTHCIGPAEPSIDVIASNNAWVIEFEEVNDITVGCDFITNYDLIVSDGTNIQLNRSILLTTSVSIPFDKSYNGSLTWVDVINNEGKKASSETEYLSYYVSGGNGKETSNFLVIVGSAIGVSLVLIILIVLLFIRIKRRRSKLPHEEQIQNEPSPFVRTESFNFPVIKGVENVYANIDADDNNITCIPVSQLDLHILEKQKQPDSFKHEFSSLPDGSVHPVTVASESYNLDKNRFKNIKAYDDSRVVLEEQDDDTSTDYINACFIPGYNGNDKFYIAGQGPLPNTISDTWRMIWQYGVTRVLMVTKEKELGKIKCERYWPNTVGELREYGDMLITLLNEEVYTDFSVRTIKCTNMGQSTKVTQFHFTSWPDKQALDTALPLLQFRHKIKSYPETGPLFVHCSAGVGRTGTYIAIDYLIEQGLAEDKVDVHQCVTKLRDHRLHMVQTTAQYESIYKTLLEAFTFGGASIPCKELDAWVDSKGSKIAQQHEDITQWIDSLPSYDGEFDGLKPENIHKNRDKSIIPDDLRRPYLNTQWKDGNDYINAVYINSYCRARSYIVTQASLPNTVVDFWRLVYDHNCGVIVSLGVMETVDYTNEADNTYYNFAETANDDNIEKYGPIEVITKDRIDVHRLTIKEMDIRLSGAQETRPLSYVELTDWVDDDLPQMDDFIELIKQIEQLRVEKEGPVLIQCLNGVEKSGLMVAALYMSEYMKLEQYVDVVNAVRSVRKYRKQLVKNQEQYEFLYRVAQSYNKRSSVYANIM